MDVIEPVKRLAETATGIGVPTLEEALACVRESRPLKIQFRDDGYIPNNQKLPLLYYRKAVRFDRRHDPAAVLEQIFRAHGWGQAWRNGIYHFVHYHSMIHEVLGISRGSATLQLGGNKGRTTNIDRRRDHRPRGRGTRVSQCNKSVFSRRSLSANRDLR